MLVTKVPANMAHIFQPLGIIVNRYAKDVTTCKFTALFQEQLNIALERGDDFGDIVISYRLSILKPLNQCWIVDLYMHMTT